MALWAAAAVLTARHTLSLLGEVPTRTDLGSFLGSAAAIAAGRDAYGPDYLSLGGFGPNLNPPISLLLFAPFAGTDPTVAFQTVLVANVVLFGTLLALLWGTQRRLEPVVWAAGAAAVDYTFRLGQIYLLLALAGAGAWLLLRARRPIAAGLLLGLLIAFKPNLAVWPLLLLAAGHRRPALWAFGTAGALWSVPLAVWGPSIYMRWLAAVTSWVNTTELANTYNASLSGVLVLFGIERLAEPVAIALVLAAAFWAWLRRPDVETLGGAAVALALLVAPLAWVGYTLLLFPYFAGRDWSLRLRAAAAFLVMPTLPFLYAAALILVLVDALDIGIGRLRSPLPARSLAGPQVANP
jgi:hypothetical protein